MTNRLASSLHTGDVFHLYDWTLRCSTDAHLDATHRVEVDVVEFPFPVHFGALQTVNVEEST
jgi:hypothetical protein